MYVCMCVYIYIYTQLFIDSWQTPAGLGAFHTDVGDPRGAPGLGEAAYNMI